MQTNRVLLILLLGLVHSTELRSHSELRGSGGLIGAFGRMAEWMVLKEIYGRDKADLLLIEVQSCAFDFAAPFSTILRNLRDSCLQGFPTSQLFQQAFSSFISLYQACPQLSTDLIKQLEVRPGGWQSLGEKAIPGIMSLGIGVDAGTQVRDVQRTMLWGRETFREIGSTGSVDYSTLEEFIEGLSQLRKDLVLDLVLALDSANALIGALTEETCEVLSFPTSH